MLYWNEAWVLLVAKLRCNFFSEKNAEKVWLQQESLFTAFYNKYVQSCSTAH